MKRIAATILLLLICLMLLCSCRLYANPQLAGMFPKDKNISTKRIDAKEYHPLNKYTTYPTTRGEYSYETAPWPLQDCDWFVLKRNGENVCTVDFPNGRIIRAYLAKDNVYLLSQQYQTTNMALYVLDYQGNTLDICEFAANTTYLEKMEEFSNGVYFVLGLSNEREIHVYRYTKGVGVEKIHETEGNQLFSFGKVENDQFVYHYVKKVVWPDRHLVWYSAVNGKETVLLEIDYPKDYYYAVPYVPEMEIDGDCYLTVNVYNDISWSVIKRLVFLRYCPHTGEIHSIYFNTNMYECYAVENSTIYTFATEPDTCVAINLSKLKHTK